MENGFTSSALVYLTSLICQEDGFAAAQNFPQTTLLSKLNQLLAGGQALTIPPFCPSLPPREILSP